MFMLCNDKLHLPIYLHETLLAQMFVFCSVHVMGVRAPLIYKMWAGPSHPYCTEVWMTILESGWNLWVWLVGMVSRR